jgi:hypothetical protein
VDELVAQHRVLIAEAFCTAAAAYSCPHFPMSADFPFPDEDSAIRCEERKTGLSQTRGEGVGLTGLESVPRLDGPHWTPQATTGQSGND